MGTIAAGDIVRLEAEEDGTWFYGRVLSLDPSGDLLLSVIDAQSWPSVALSGYIPGRKYRMPQDRVLSVVQSADH